jgi:hypothetical protein
MIEAIRRRLAGNEPDPIPVEPAEPIIVELAQDADNQRNMDRAMIEIQKRLQRDPVSGLVRGTYSDVRRGAARRREVNAQP